MKRVFLLLICTALLFCSTTTVSVISKSVTQTDTYEGWNYVETSFTSSGGTVALAGKLTKLLIMRTSFTIGLECDANGNIITT